MPNKEAIEEMKKEIVLIDHTGCNIIPKPIWTKN
jgi:hypothetical protein